MAKTPTRSPELRRLVASAMWSPVRFCLTLIVRMSASAAASMMGLTGYPIRNSTPSRFRISATRAATFMFSSRNVPYRTMDAVLVYIFWHWPERTEGYEDGLIEFHRRLAGAGVPGLVAKANFGVGSLPQVG